MKKLLLLLAVAAVLFPVGLRAEEPPVDIIFEHFTREHLARGVVYDQRRLITARGMLDVHVLQINLRQPYISLAPVAHPNVPGGRMTVRGLLENAGAIAGVNAAYFGMDGSYSPHFGVHFEQGQQKRLNTYTNARRDEFGTFFMDVFGNPVFDYVRPVISLYRHGVQVLSDMGHMDILGNMLLAPTIFTHGVLESTHGVLARLGDASTFVVENGVITYISPPYEPVYVPQDGWILVMPRAQFLRYAWWWQVGDTLHYNVNAGFDLNRMQMAVGGGGILLRGGYEVNDYGVFMAGRQPRTALGVTPDGRLIMLVADGRTHSVGATRAELIWLLRGYGVVDAMALDGGGSATMVTRTDAGVYSTVNTPSDGNPRRVVNALGVFNNAPIGAMISLEIEPAATQVSMLLPVEIRAFGRDTNRNRLPITNPANVAFMADPSDGFFHYGRYIPVRAGLHRVHAVYGGFTAYVEFYAMETAYLRISRNRIHTIVGAETPLSFTGISTCGNTLYVNRPTSLSVHPYYLGHFAGNYFVATGAGMGHIAAAIGGVRAYVALYVAEFPEHLLPEYDEILYPYDFDALEYVLAHPGLREWLAGGAYATAPEGTVFVDRWRTQYHRAGVPFLRVEVPETGTAGVPWANLADGITMFGSHIVLVLDTNPLAFSRRAEFYLLHDVLVSKRAEGSQVFVISPAAEGTTMHIRDAIRYISTDSDAITLFNYGGEVFWMD
jgi:hypothetical protein